MIINAKSTRKKSSACSIRRNSGLHVKEGERDVFSKTSVIRRAVEGYKYGVLKKNEVDGFIEAEMAKIPGCLDVTIRAWIREAEGYVNRYLDTDPRTCAKPQALMINVPGGHKLSVTPDFMYTEPGIVEVISYTTGKQYMSSKVLKEKETESIRYSLEAYGLLLYGREFLPDKTGKVRVCFDALKVGNDRTGTSLAPWKTAKRQTGSTKTADNRCWMEVSFDKGDLVVRNGEESLNKTLLDNYHETLTAYVNGITDCPKKVCDECSLAGICKANLTNAVKPEETEAVTKYSDTLLTREQKDIVEFNEGIALVCAGAGTGKTNTMSVRISRLLLDGVKPEKILVLSYSTAAVAEMVERTRIMTEEILPGAAKKIKMATFNSLGNEAIMANYQMFGYSEKPVLIDSITEYELAMKSMICEIPGLNYRNPHMDFGGRSKGAVKQLLDWYHTIGTKDVKDGDVHAAEKIGCSESVVADVFKCYREFKRLMVCGNYIDYSDQSNLISKTIDELNDEVIFKDYSFEHIIVDEFQDSNDFQLKLIKAFVFADSFKSLMVVGDDSQAIYGFRGATPDNMIHFREKMQMPVTELYLTKSFRCTREITALGNAVIANNDNRVPKTIRAREDYHGPMPELYRFLDREREIKYIAQNIKTKIMSGVSPDDIAVLAPKSSVLANIKDALSEIGVPAQLVTKELGSSNARITAALGLAGFFRDITDTKGLAAYINVCEGGTLMDGGKMGLVNETAAAFEEITKEMTKEELSSLLMTCISVMDNSYDPMFTQFYNGINKADCLEYLTKYERYGLDFEASKEPEPGTVSLMTIHGSKGREWKYVYGSITDLSAEGREELEEKIRLLYVMITRAKTDLHLTSAVIGKKPYKTHPFVGVLTATKFISDNYMRMLP